MERKEFRNLSKAIEQGRFDETMQGNFLMKASFPLIKAKMQEYLDASFRGHTGKAQRYVSYLCNGDVDVLTYVVLQSVIKKIAQKSNIVKTTTMSDYITFQLKKVRLFESVVESNPKLIAYLGNEYRRASARRKEEMIAKHLESFNNTQDRSTGNDDEDIRVGAILIDLVIQSGADIIQQTRRWQNGVDRYATYYISFTDSALEGLQGIKYISPTLALYPPMIVPPMDWTHYKIGGYLTVELPFIKLKFRKERDYVSKQNLDEPYRAINKLQKTAWKVNGRIADVIREVYEGNMIDPTSPPTLPRLYGDIPTSIPTKVEDVLDGFGNYPENPTPTEKKAWALWNRKREGIKIELDGETGRRLQYLMTMGVVDKMINYKQFYYVYQLDYRGRVYPVTDFFNPQSKGYVKAMLEFANGHLLDKRGIYWLKIHSANTYGLDKELFPDRIKWAEDNRIRMLETARAPMSNLGYWTAADSPYEFLAACMALQDHIEGRLVHLPIQLDAVNSGIQMYSGLLRDKEGAQSTCVIGDVRSDLYQEVADRVEQKLTSGTYPPIIAFIDKEGIEKTVPTKAEATSMIGNFTRSMTKKNVMTVPYSVSMRGMKMQNWDTMYDMTLKGKKFWEGDEWVVNYLWTTLTHESIFEIVKGARAGQEYLKDVVRLLEDATLWYTPIYGLPVYQALFKSKQMRVQTILGTLQILEFTDEPKRQKQVASVAANYIHSIDATILMYVIDKISGDIGTIHDCFLVHPNLGEEVRDKYKEGYVEVMRADPLKMFSEELDKEGKVEIPYVGDLNLDDVYDSEYIIS